MKVEIPATLEGARVDVALATLAGVSRVVAQGWLTDGQVLLDGLPPPASHRVQAGAQLEYQPPQPVPTLQPEPVPFQVRFEDDQLAVVDKPSGLVTHPGAGVDTGTLAAGLLNRWPELLGVGEPNRPGLVHRLDRETSGLLLIAKTAAAHTALRRQLADRQIRRVYTTLTQGLFDFGTGTIDAPIARDERRPTRFMVSPLGRSARTHYRRLSAWEAPGLTLLEVRLETGRTHQIRVHLSAIGHPVVGDELYEAKPGPAGDPGRVWLHASSLVFNHPVGGQPIQVESALPPDLVNSLDRLGPPPTT